MAWNKKMTLNYNDSQAEENNFYYTPCCPIYFCFKF